MGVGWGAGREFMRQMRTQMHRPNLTRGLSRESRPGGRVWRGEERVFSGKEQRGGHGDRRGSLRLLGSKWDMTIGLVSL